MPVSQHLVLVVDDDRGTAYVIAALLEEAGFASRAANTALDALRDYEALRPALVITDESLRGDVTGSELVRTLRRKYGEAVGRTVFLTGAPETVQAMPTDVVIEKPVDFQTLVATVRSLLEGPPVTRQAK